MPTTVGRWPWPHCCRSRGADHPGLLDKPLNLPKGADALETSIPRVAREYGMLVYPLDKQLDALLTQVAAGNPVLLRYQEGSAWWSEPRYAVLIGYDSFKSVYCCARGCIGAS